MTWEEFYTQNNKGIEPSMPWSTNLERLFEGQVEGVESGSGDGSATR